jgi:hypothetical protein
VELDLLAERVALQGVDVHGVGLVLHGIDILAERVALQVVAEHGVGLDLQAERVALQKQCPRHGGVGLDLHADRVALQVGEVHGVGLDLHAERVALQVQETAMKEFFIGDLPNTSTREFVEGIFSQFGIVMRCELLHNNEGLLLVKLRMATHECAKLLVQHVDGNMDVGLEETVFVGFFHDYSAWWVV